MKPLKKKESAEIAAKAEEAKTKASLEQASACELDDDDLDGVAGGLVQLVNPSSNRP